MKIVRVSVSQLGCFDEMFRTMEEARAYLHRRRGRKPVIGPFSAPEPHFHYGQWERYTVAKWWRAGESADRYEGKIVCFYQTEED